MTQRKVRIQRSATVHVDIVIEVADPPLTIEWQSKIGAATNPDSTSSASCIFLDVHLITCEDQLSVGKPVAVTLPNGNELPEPTRQKDLDLDFAGGHTRRCWTVPDPGDASMDPVIVIPVLPRGEDAPSPVQCCITFRLDSVSGPYYDPVGLAGVPSGLTFLTG